MPASELEQLREQIREAFPPTRFHGSVTNLRLRECLDLRKALGGQRKDEVPTAFPDLLRGLDDLNDQRVVLEFTVYCLCPSTINGKPDLSGRRYLEERAAVMTPAQVQVALRRVPRQGRQMVQALR
jgi:hypothetical protein